MEASTIGGGLASGLMLDLTFNLQMASSGLVDDLPEAQLLALEHSDPSLFDERDWFDVRATTGDCSVLLGEVGHWLSVAGRISSQYSGTRELFDPIASFKNAAESSAPAVAPEIDRLHYASPLEISLTVGTVSLPGVAALLILGKYLYGYDLELRAHREERRERFLRAKARADELEKHLRDTQDPPDPLPSRRPSMLAGVRVWKLIGGVLRENDSAE